MTLSRHIVRAAGLAAALLAAAPAGTWAANRLRAESSPYLLEHADNPVDWYPWGDAAFAEAQRTDRPVFVSIGYSACHWCHVMEREVFADPEVARALRGRFVAIKVDREERPDLDALYMGAVLAMTGRGGWPLTVFLTPDRKPFYGGTFFPKRDFLKLLDSLDRGWRERRAEVLATAENVATLVTRLQDTAGGAGVAPGDFETRVLAELRQTYDAQNGGFGAAPKFPPHGGLLLLLAAARDGDARALEMATATLDAMARGGLHDQVGGGFHRYSTDAQWITPHFEKMLYDNALLVPVYLEAWKATGREDFRSVARDTLAFVKRDLTLPEGGFAASLDADSEGEEGRYYLWSRAQIAAAVGAGDGPVVADFFGLPPAGAAAAGSAVLHVPLSPADFASRHGLDPAAWSGTLARARAALLKARGRRPVPQRNDTAIAAWNGLMITAWARAHALTGDPDSRAMAERAARFALDRLRPGGALHATWRRGRPGPAAFLDDYAFLARGLLDLSDATGEIRWRDAAADLVRAAAKLRDRDRGGYFFAEPGQADLIAAPRRFLDDALPSGNAVMAECLLRLGGDDGATHRDEARRIFALAGPALASAPASGAYLALAARLDRQEVTVRDALPSRTGPRIASEALAATEDAPPSPRGTPAPAGADKVVPPSWVGKPAPQRVVTTELRLPDRPVRPGQAVVLSIRFDIAKGWHVNSNHPTLEYLIPTRVEFPDTVHADQVDYPEAHMVTLKFADTRLSVYEGTNTIRATVRPPRDAKQGPLAVAARLTWQACSDTSCLVPETVEFPVPLEIRGEPVAESEMPRPPSNTAAPSGGESMAKTLQERGLLALLGLVFLGGLALNLTPCVYPMLPVTLGFFASQTRSGWLPRIALPSLYVLGMAITYSALGVAAGLSGGLIGSTLQSPWIVGVLVILFVVLGLGMFGLFELRLPGSLTSRLGGGRRGPVGAVLMGLTMGLVAAPCIGPFVVGLLAFVGAAGSPILGFWLFFVMAIGMGLPNLFLGVFSGSLASLPRSGEWMVFAKKVMGLGLFGVALYFLQPFLADRVMGFLVAVFALIAAAYVGFLEKTRLRSSLFPAVRLLLAAGIVAAGAWLATPLLASRPDAGWQPYSPEALTAATAAGRPVLIDFSAEWCLACKELERFTFTDPVFLDEARRFALLRADLTAFESKEVRATRDRFDVVGLPTLVFIDGAGRPVDAERVYGFEDAPTFVARMRRIR